MSNLMIKNVNIIDMVNPKPYKSNILIKDGKIKEINTSISNQNVETLDGKEQFIIPGFIDTHSHLLLYGLFKELVDVRPEIVKNISDIKKALKQQLPKKDSGEWIVGQGYNELELDEERHITKQELDEVSTEHPIYLRHSSAHMGVANSKALEIANINDETENPEGGYFSKTDGTLNGLLYELPAVEKLLPYLPKPSKEEMIDALKNAAQDYIEKGITTASEASVGLAHGKDDISAYHEYIQLENDINLRIMIDYQLLLNDERIKDKTYQELNEQIQTLSNQKCTLDSAKFFQDGSIQINTAALTQPYKNEKTKSEIIIKQETLESLYTSFAEKGFPLTTHANGDAAIKSIIKAYSKIQSLPNYNHETRIEHIQTGEYEDIVAMKNNQISGSFFTNHIYYFGDQHYEKFLGPNRANLIDPARWAEDLGVLYTLHSDCPVTPISPIDNIMIACNRKTKSGRTLGEELKLTRLESLKAMTINGSKLNHTENQNGTIEPNKNADFVILNHNPLDESIDLNDDMIQYTIIGGKVVYKRS